MPVQNHFKWLDYVILSLMLLVSCIIGLYHAWKNQSEADYLLGNRQMKWWPVALSLIVTFYSGISQIGKPAEIYLYGIQFSVGIIGIALCMLFVMYTFLPLLFKLKLTCSYEYLELRFESKAVRLLSSCSVIFTQILYCGLSTYIPAMALGTVTGFPVWASILCVGAVVTFYTMLGGLKGVVLIDAFQFFIMTASMIIITTFGLLKMGGITEVWEVNKVNGRLNFFNFDPNPLVRMSFWSLVFGNFFKRMPYYSINQACVQRFCCVPSLQQAKLVLLMAVLSLCFMEVVIYFHGLLIYSYFSGCDPLNHPDLEKRLDSPNELLPLFVMEVVNWPGLPGLFMASILSGSLSTVSSSLNALAAVTWEDFFKLKFRHLSDRKITNILKVMVIFYGMAATGFAFLTIVFKASVLQIAISFLDTSSSPLLGMFILGAFFRRANWLGVLVGSCLGFCLPMWMSIGSFVAISLTPPLNTSIAECVWSDTDTLKSTVIFEAASENKVGLENLYSVSFLWFPAIGTLTTVITGIVSSMLTAPFITSVAPTDVKDEYVIIALDHWQCKMNNQSKKEKVELDLKLEAI